MKFVWKRENLEVLSRTQQTLKWFLQGELNVVFQLYRVYLNLFQGV